MDFKFSNHTAITVLYFILSASMIGIISGTSLELKGDLHYRIRRTIVNTLGSCFVLALLLVLTSSDWSVVSGSHGTLSFKIVGQVPLAEMALFLIASEVVAVCTITFIVTHEYMFLPSKPPKTFRKTPLIRKRSKSSTK